MSGLCSMSNLFHASVSAYKEAMTSLHKGMEKVMNGLLGLQLGADFSPDDFVAFIAAEHKRKKECQFMGCCLA